MKSVAVAALFVLCAVLVEHGNACARPMLAPSGFPSVCVPFTQNQTAKKTRALAELQRVEDTVPASSPTKCHRTLPGAFFCSRVFHHMYKSKCPCTVLAQARDGPVWLDSLLSYVLFVDKIRPLNAVGLDASRHSTVVELHLATVSCILHSAIWSSSHVFHK